MMRSSISLNDIISEKRPKILCDKCIIKQMIEYGDGCYWPTSGGRWEYFMPEVEVSNCLYLTKILKGLTIKEEDKTLFDNCKQFLLQIDWNGLRKDDIKIMQALSDFIFLSSGIRTDTDTLIEVFREVRKMKNIRIVSTAAEGDNVFDQFAYERVNYNLFGAIRDAVTEVSKQDD